MFWHILFSVNVCIKKKSHNLAHEKGLIQNYKRTKSSCWKCKKFLKSVRGREKA